VVFIEGDSEDIAFPIIADSLGFDLCGKGIRLVNVRGSGKYKKMKEYLEYLKGSGVMSYVIADGNKEVKGKLEDWEREGIIAKGNWTVWDLEFEDCFSYDMIAQAINEVIKEQGGDLEITVKQLEEEKREGISVDLDKPALAEKLALMLSAEIGKDKHLPTPPEKEIKKIVRLVDKKYQKAG
jgi:predicted ATP-dependent endonuclease of OLD family